MRFTDSLFAIYFCIDRTRRDKEAGGCDSWIKAPFWIPVWIGPEFNTCRSWAPLCASPKKLHWPECEKNASLVHPGRTGLRLSVPSRNWQKWNQGLQEVSVLKKQHRKQTGTSVKILTSAQLKTGRLRKYLTYGCLQRKCRQVLSLLALYSMAGIYFLHC